MGIKEGQTEYNLSRPIKYSRQGDSNAEAMYVLLQEPGMEHEKFYLRLKQMLTRCQMEFAKQATEIQDTIGEDTKPLHQDTDRIEDETEELAEMFIMALMASESVDPALFVETFQKMATHKGQKSVCLIDGKQPMTGALWQRLHPDDAFSMAVRWCVFFGMPSAETEKTTSGQQSGSATELREA